MTKHGQLAEEVALTALKMRSALTPAYASSLKAADALHRGDARSAAGHLWDAALMADEDVIAVAFEQHARDAEALMEED